jgi:hypothetical protein
MRVRTPVTSASGPGGSAGPAASGHTATQPPSRDFGRLLIGLVVVTAGVLLLLDTAGVLRADRIIDHWWPVVIIAAGALTLAERPRARARGTILTGAGVLLLLFSTHVLDEGAWDYVWPLALIVVGLVIVARWRGRSMPKGVVADDVIRSTAVFSGAELGSSSPLFRGAWLTAIFGGVALDLRDSRPDPEGATVNATAVFGGIDLLVPRGWRITVKSLPVFGGVGDKTDHSVPLAPDAPVLHIDAVSIFGGVSIKHEK